MSANSGLIFLFFLFQCFVIKGQDNNQRCRWIKTFNKPITIDSLSLVPHSITLQDNDTSEVRLSYDAGTGKVLISAPESRDSVQVCYSVLPFSLQQRFYHRSLSVYDSNAFFKDPVSESDQLLQREELFSVEGLNKSGSISRGISFGNNQDVFVNSTLNLNLEGKLTDDLNIRASITDQNVPFQPEGNTQQLQDFDNVFIQIYNDKFSVTGGDVVLKNRPSYFLKYYKNVQGALAEMNYGIGDSKASSTLGVSVAKGKFASVIIEPLEGVQGPYRIPSPAGQSFVIVLANSEKVFLDGKQLTRGYNNDYIIDYNGGEVTFTNKILITEFSRIRVDYEYSDQNYNRTIVAASHYQEAGKLDFYVNAYSEQDNRNRPLLVELNNDDKLLLSQVGDNLNDAVISGADSVGFSNDLILYRQRDTVDNAGDAVNIYEYSTNPDSAFYKVTFSEVGLGNGNYIQLQTTANGRVFSWVSPEGGVPQGQYEPVISIPPPNKKQMVNAGVNYKINSHENFFTEIAFSNQDLNLYSEMDSKDDTGYAMKSGFKSDGREVSFLDGYTWQAFADVEFDDQYFNPIDRFRYIEYDRDWGYTSGALSADDFITNLGAGMKKDDNNELNYQLSYRKRGEQINGFQHKAGLDKEIGNFQIKSDVFYLSNNTDSLDIFWSRFNGDLSYETKWFVPGYQYNMDHNRVKLKQNDSTERSALYFDEQVFYIKNNPSSEFQFLAEHSYREDKRPIEGEIQNYSRSNTSRLTMNKDFDNQEVGLLFTYRKLNYEENLKSEETLSGRLDVHNSLFDRHVISDLTYSISNGRELRREFVYIKVPPGEGTHTWRDLNNDDIQDINEFFEAINPDERNYAKIFIPTNEFITAFQNILTYRISLQMPRSWQKEKGWKEFFSRFSNSTSWSADVKTTDKAINSRLLGFAKNIQDELLISEKNILRSTLFYNRTSPDYGADMSYYNASQKQLLSNGFEFRGTEEYTLNIRVNLTRLYSLKMKTINGRKNVKSDFLEGRNYQIDYYKINPEISWQPAGNFRVSGQYSYEAKENTFMSESSERAYFHEVIMEVKINKAVTSTFNGHIRLINIDFTGEENSPIGYDMLNALRPGTNITWGVNWQQKIASGLQLNLSYDGRKSEDSDIIHVGRVQVSALF